MMNEMERRLVTHGSDLSRWPDGGARARETLLAQPGLQRAWEKERDLDRALVADRDALDAEIRGSGAVARLGRLSARQSLEGLLGGIPWRRVAAGVLLAGMLGGALGLMLPGRPPDPTEMALVDPLAGPDAR